MPKTVAPASKPKREEVKVKVLREYLATLKQLNAPRETIAAVEKVVAELDVQAAG